MIDLDAMAQRPRSDPGSADRAPLGGRRPPPGGWLDAYPAEKLRRLREGLLLLGVVLVAGAIFGGDGGLAGLGALALVGGLAMVIVRAGREPRGPGHEPRGNGH